MFILIYTREIESQSFQRAYMNLMNVELFRGKYIYIYISLSNGDLFRGVTFFGFHVDRKVN